MNPHDEHAERPDAAASTPAWATRLESTLELATRELLRERRSERRWRIFFRLVWLGLALAVCASLQPTYVHLEMGLEAGDKTPAHDRPPGHNTQPP